MPPLQSPRTTAGATDPAASSAARHPRSRSAAAYESCRTREVPDGRVSEREQMLRSPRAAPAAWSDCTTPNRLVGRRVDDDERQVRRGRRCGARPRSPRSARSPRRRPDPRRLLERAGEGGGIGGGHHGEGVAAGGSGIRHRLQHAGVADRWRAWRPRARSCACDPCAAPARPGAAGSRARAIAASTRARVAGSTRGLALTTRETVCPETPAQRCDLGHRYAPTRPRRRGDLLAAVMSSRSLPVHNSCMLTLSRPAATVLT